jgi:murein DD-endopeptidase MepM/ murein hydrolase activator NlpD
MKSVLKVILFFIILFSVYCILAPSEYVMPVKGATRSSYNQQSFWAYPWGSSGHHKGVDIFHKKGTPVLSATKGIVVFKGVLSKGGNAILIFGPRLRLHYYAHLDAMQISYYDLVNAGEQIATVGSTGNAKGKPPHLHYSISRIIPRIGGTEEWIKRFYDNPIPLLNAAVAHKK